MFSVRKAYLPLLALSIFVAGGSRALALSPAQTINLPDAEMGNFQPDDDYVPDVTARVARISFFRGDAQIRRTGTTDWERVTLNLPIVEGDEITTAAGSRVEIQFDTYQHLRLDENSYLQVVKLKDEGIAVSVSEGRLSVSLTRFDKDRAYFEIDAPDTTLAVEHTGTYRVDAGKRGDDEVRVAATDDGEARVYSDNAGFTLKNGRSARVFIDGANAGEFETAEASRYADEFDSWAVDRDAEIAKRLKDAYYDKYYDNDIYGAEDLNDNGEWIHLRDYGYVWRPFRTSISTYTDWSPYRYGNWRWVPPYGWTWVNDEPWGWATYHHGRWFYDDGNWYWSPYGYYRYSRSWWFPALVVVNIFSNNVCWYPLPYSYGYYNYNSYYNHHNGWNGHHNGGHNPPHGGGPTPTPTPAVALVGPRSPRPKTPPFGQVPPAGVVSLTTSDFGTGIKGPRTPPLATATAVLSQAPADTSTQDILPSYANVKVRGGRDIKTAPPPQAVADTQIKTGAAPRKTDAPLDQELRNTRIFGNRKPVATDPGVIKTVPTDASGPRKTGAVDRPPVKQTRDPDPVTQTPVNTPRPEQPVKVDTPKYEPPVRQETPRPDPVRPQPRYDPPPKQETPRPEPRPQPRNDPPPKSEPKPDPKPSSPAPSEKHGGKTKDGR